MNRSEQEKLIKNSLRYAISKSPGFAAIALWSPYFINGDHVASTNGRSIRIGTKFFNYQPMEQVAILVHEILHIALRHISRGLKGKFSQGNYNFRLWNICADAIINETIARMDWLSLPADAIRLQKLLTSNELYKMPAQTWSCEKLYAFLWQHPERISDLICDCDLEADGLDDQPLDDAIWRERLIRAQAGDRPGGLLRAIEQDFPNENTRWERLLRRLMTQPLLRTSVVNWSRPNRRTLSLNNDFYEPSTKPDNGLYLAGVVIDTSGSITRSMLERFAREVQTIQQRTNCQIYLISADAAVQTEDLIKNDGRSFSKKLLSNEIILKGGGGTDFYPALQAMKKKRVRVVVYLTDMYGNFGPDEHYPFQLIWATTTKNVVAPFGKTIYLESDE